MILKVSHLVFSSTDFEENSNDFAALGYTCTFTEIGLKNLEIKKPLFKYFSKKHDVRYFASPQGVSIELLNWGSKSRQPSNFIPVFQNLPQKKGRFEWQLKQIKRLTSRLEQPKKTPQKIFPFEEAVIPSLQLPIFYQCLSNREGLTTLNGLYVKTDNLEKSISFWKNFRFEVCERWEKEAVLKLKVFLPQSILFTLYLSETSQSGSTNTVNNVNEINKNPHLDDIGVSCLSFLSSSVEKEKDLLKRAGLRLIDVGSLRINQKQLTIIFVLGPSGELVEVIDVKDCC